MQQLLHAGGRNCYLGKTNASSGVIQYCRQALPRYRKRNSASVEVVSIYYILVCMIWEGVPINDKNKE